VKFSVAGDRLRTSNADTNELALADRDREVYVAITRAKKSLTILHDPEDRTPYMAMNPAIEKLFQKRAHKKHRFAQSVLVMEST